jgi:MFS family permease
LSDDSLLKQRDFFLFMVGRLLANVGAQMQTVAVGWAVYSRTSNPLDLGWIGLSQFAPFVVLILPAGHFADHHDRRRIVTLCYFVQALCAVALCILTWANVAAVWPIFAVMTVLGVARAFAMPSSQALLPNLIPPEHFGRAVAVNSIAFQTSSILGPTIGGLLLLGSVQIVFAAVVVCAVAAMVTMSRVRARPAAEHSSSEAELGSLLSGLQFVRSRPIVLGAISLDLFAVLFGGATALLPIYARDILHVGPTGLGMLRSAPGVGAVVCALWLTASPIKRHVGRWLFISVITFGLATMVFGIAKNFMLSLAALAVLGAGDMMSVFVRGYLVQLVTPDYIRGRVSAVSAVFIGASNELGEFESGVTAAWWGTVGAVIVGGAATVSISLLWMKLFPALRKLDEFPPAAR